MAEAKNESKSKSESAEDVQKREVKEAGAQEVQERVDEETAQGFAGVEVDPIPNEEYSLQSGPDSPTAADTRKALAERDANRDLRN